MRVIKNQNMFSALSQNLVNLEMSNMAMALQTPTILTTYYRIESDMSEVMHGWRNVDDFISSDSPVVFDKIENFPICGIDSLLTEGAFDDEVGYTEDLTTSAVSYPNTIFPKPNDCFIINNNPRTAIFVVTDVETTTSKSNPFTKITFRLKSVREETITQLDKQVHNVYMTVMSPIGNNRSLVVLKSSVNSVNAHLKSYLEIAQLYTMLFYDENKAAFVFDGIPGDHNERRCFIDMTLWKFMFDEGIIIYDDLIAYANSNGQKTVDRVYTGCPDIYLDEHAYHRSILYRIYDNNYNNIVKKSEFDRYRFPYIYEPTPRITKYQGQNIWYLETYLDHPSSHDATRAFYIWDDEFLCRIRHNDPYPEVPMGSGICTQCEMRCSGKPVLCFNSYLRNVVIHWFNNGTIDWDSIQITDDRTIENYYMIPLVLGIYKKYIQGLAN